MNNKRPGEEFIVELDNATLTNIKGYQTAKADMTLTINRADLEKTLMGGKSLEAQLGDGRRSSRATRSSLRRSRA